MMWWGILGAILGLIGLIFHINWLFYAGGLFCLLIEVIAILTKKLNPFFPIITMVFCLSIIGGITGSFIKGLLIGAMVTHLIEIIGIFVFAYWFREKH